MTDNKTSDSSTSQSEISIEPEVIDANRGALVPVSEQPPSVLPVVLLEDLVPFPGAVVPVLLETQERRDAVLHAKSLNGFFGLVNRYGVSHEHVSDLPETEVEVRLGDEEADDLERANVVSVQDLENAIRGGEAEIPQPTDEERAEEGGKPGVKLRDLSRVGILARLIKVFKLPDGRLSALVQLMRRMQPIEVLKTHPFPVLKVMYPVEVVNDGPEFQAVCRQLKNNLQSYFEAHPSIPDEMKVAALAVEEPGSMADFVAQHLSRDFDERLGFLNELDLSKRVFRALEVVVRELDLLTVGNRITQEIREKVEKHQREFFLREQLKSIRTELGEEKDPVALATAELKQKLDEAKLPEHARERADEELRRLSLVSAESPEHNVVRSYLEWIASLPWSKTSDDATDLDFSAEVLDADHYGLQEVKERILEFLAVHQLNPSKPGSILCFAGPPGVGKTSLGQSIARALGRKFYRFSVGGMRDEAEIKGHRRTYVGAMPGRILQALKQVETANPIIMLDEIDKMGSDWRGDPSSAMLEVLDPSQNQNFLDHYLDLTFDLSRVMFIATANVKSEIPLPLLDRMEVIDLPGYIPEEKIEIAARYLVPRQRKAHGLAVKQLRVGKPALRRIVREYTHEAGVRELDRQVAKICRKRATQVVRKQTGGVSVGGTDVPTWLGPPKLHDDRINKKPIPGVVIGLAWTAVGGDVLFIESALMPGKGQLKVTGQLGDVMSESANLAMSYVRSKAEQLEIDAELLSKYDIHLHFPAGAVKKDGPSAGITVTTALISLLKQKAVRPRIAMTGEMTLRGEVLPVGGIREKVVAARRAGIATVILPERNRADFEEIPPEVRDRITPIFASEYEQVFDAALGAPKKRAKSGPKRRKTKRDAEQPEAAGGAEEDEKPTTKPLRVVRA